MNSRQSSRYAPHDDAPHDDAPHDDAPHAFAPQGYTSENVGDKGIHEVAARRFVLVSQDHPLVSAIQENQERLQMGQVSVMPEGLVKISSSLYETISPLVASQVASQIKVRDFSNCSVSIEPSEYQSWADAHASMMSHAKTGLQNRKRSALTAAKSEDAQKLVMEAFKEEETAIEKEINEKSYSFSATLGVEYNFLSK
jgi:hypothetical protein